MSCPQSSLAGVLVGELGKINLVLALFNLIPGLPLDGGQVLKAAVWKVTGNRFQAVHWAARAGQLLGVVSDRYWDGNRLVHRSVGDWFVDRVPGMVWHPQC
jgi:membrane-associated protease RseP (regulator of RpoE activity)